MQQSIEQPTNNRVLSYFNYATKKIGLVIFHMEKIMMIVS